MTIFPKSVSVVVATYFGYEYMQGLFESLAQQTHQPHEIIIIENSDDKPTRDAIRRYATPQTQIYSQERNLDFALGYNVGMQKATADYILILNQDLILEPNAIEELLKVLDSDERIAAVAPKLLRLEEGEKTAIIDAMGLVADKKRRFTNRGEGEQDRGQYDNIKEVFGLSGTAVLFKRKALEDVTKHSGGELQEYFDNAFIAYKEDVDLSYRFHHRGWKMAIAPRAILYHKRTAQETKQSTTKGLRANREQKSFRIRGNSLRNQWWILIKNEPLANLIVHSPWIGYYECGKLLYILFNEPSTLKIVPSFFKHLPQMLRKRQAILNSSTITSSTLRHWFR